jgi:hypothetical protein
LTSRRPSGALLLCLVAVASLALVSSPAAQQPNARPIVAASGRASTSVSFDGRLMGGGAMWLNRSTSHSGPARMTIDYGQPHARGRKIFGGLVPYGEVWRLGANMATHLTLDLDVRIGKLRIPRGEYTLYLLPRQEGADLIVNRQTRQWGTEYDASLDLGRVPLAHRALPETAQSLIITLEPVFPQPEGTLPSGRLRIAWGDSEYSTDWQVAFASGS